ncbi:DUF2256 domain-containing protein [Muriicola sp. SD30]|uniref:DUF2256 domain-containing protein n=1 Tax=Muriicola sp. SD30 TaxID=3240936 RepID=UPI00350FD490
MQGRNLNRILSKMAHKKLSLPEKVCVRCGRPFSWRKKWKRDWAEVRYCSERCRRNNRKLKK